MKWTKVIYIFLFSAIIISSPIAFLLNYEWLFSGNFKNMRNSQKVVYQPIVWSYDGIRNYLPNLNRYYDDNFGLQRQYVFLNSISKYAFNISPNNKKVIYGKNDFFFEGNDLNNAIDQYTGKEVFNDEELTFWVDSYFEMKQFLNSKGVEFYFFVPPEKQTVYAEYLPDYIKKGSNIKIQQLLSNINDDHFIFLADTLIASKQKYNDLLYHKTDTHWSSLGAYIGYRKIISSINKKFNNIQAIELDTFNILKNTWGWDLAFLAGLTGYVPDFRAEVKLKEPTLNITQYNLFSNTAESEMKLNVGVKDQLSYVNSDKKLSVVVFKDSHAEALSPFLTRSFGKTTYFHYTLPESRLIDSILNYYNPNIFIFEMGERLISQFPEVEKKMYTKATFDDKKLIATYKNSDFIEKSHALHFIKPLSNTNQFEYEVQSNGSCIFFKPIDSLNSDIFFAKLEITAPEPTIIRFFYTTKEHPDFSEFNVFTSQISQGFNQLFFTIRAKDVLKNIRLDPGYKKGRYILHSFELRK